MSQSGVLGLAKAGDAEAITYLLNQALLPTGVRARVVRKVDRLHVLLEAQQLPHPQTYTRIVYQGILHLGLRSIHSVQVYGRKTGDRLPAWTRVLSLHAPTLPQRPPSSRPAVPRVQRARRRIPIRRARLPLALLSVTLASFGLGASIHYLTHTPASEVASSDSTPRHHPSPKMLAWLQQPGAPVKQPGIGAPVITLKAVGDIVPGTNFPDDRLPDGNGENLFSSVKPFFANADILFGNFESTLTDYPYPAKDTSQGMTFAFRTPPSFAQTLKQAGFNVLSVANNHSMDFNEQGFADTIQNLEQAGIKPTGKKGEITYLTVRNIPIAFIGFSFLADNNPMQDLPGAIALVQQAKQQAKIVVISVHAGAEGTDASHVSDQTEYFFGEDRGNLLNFAHTMIDHGADLVLGHGPHVPRAIELYNNKLIAYSLGNFVGYRTLSTAGSLSYSLILQAQLDASGNFVTGRVIPVALDADGTPFIDDYFQSVIFVRNLIREDFPQTPIVIDDMGWILRNAPPPADSSTSG